MNIAKLALPLIMTVLLAPAAAAQISTNPAEGFIGHQAGGGRARSGCRPAPQPRHLPPLSSLGDSAGLVQAIDAFARANPVAGDSTPFALFSVNLAGPGAVTLRPIDYWLPAGQAAAFASLVSPFLNAGPPETGTVRLRLILGETPAARIEQSQVCPAEIRGRFQLRTGTPQQRRTQPTLRVRARVAADGSILSAQILRSSGDMEIDQWVQSALSAGSAVPGLVDGIPTLMDAEQEIRVRID